MKSAERPSIVSSMREFTRISALEPAKSSFQRLELNRAESMHRTLVRAGGFLGRSTDTHQHGQAHIVAIQGTPSSLVRLSHNADTSVAH